MRTRFTRLGFFLLLLISFSLALLSPLSVAAQGDEKEKAQKEDEKRQELERQTLAMLDEVAAQALSLKLPENRSLVLVNAADLLWTHDEKRARNLFWDALNNLTSQTANSVGDELVAKDSTANDSVAKRPANDKAQTVNQYFATFQLRREFLRKVARRDPQLALDMLRATRLAPPAQPSPDYHLPDERELEQEIANEAAARDPKRALQIARESLSKGFTYQVMGVLFNLNRQSPDAASEFAGDVIDRLQTTNVGTDVAAGWTAVGLLRAASPAQVVATGDSVLESNRIKLSDDQRRELVEIVTNATLSATGSPTLLYAIVQVMPDVEQFAPDRAAKIKMKLADLNRTLTKEQREFGKYDDLVSKGTPEELLRAAAGANDSQRDALFQAAAMKAVMKGKADALREFVKSEVDDEGQRNRLNDLLDEQQIGWDLNHGDTEGLQKLLPSIRLKEKRAVAMAELALLLEKKGEHDEALKLLDEAQTLVKVDLKSDSQSNALLAVMLAYSLIDPSKAFAMVEPIIDRANDNISKLVLVDKLIKSGFVKNGEIVMQQPGMISPDFAVFKYGKGMVALAKADFNRTKAMADRFQRNELRILARLLVVQALLHENEKAVKTNDQ